MGWIVKRVGFFEGSKLTGVVQILEKRLPLGFSLFYIPRGPIINWMDEYYVNNVLNSLINIVKNLNKTRKLFLRIEPPINNGNKILSIFKKSGFKQYFKTIQPQSTLLINLVYPENLIFKNLRRNARNLIYRSRREGVRVMVLDYKNITENELKGFYSVYALTGKRFSFPLRPYKQFKILLEEFGPDNMILLYTAYINNLTLARGLVVLLNNKAFYIWGGSIRHPYYSKFFSYYYIWEMLMDLKNRGINVFDFWGLGPLDKNNNSLDKNHPWYGFSLFKTAFGGERFDYIGTFDFPLSNFYFLFKLTDKIITPKHKTTSS